MCSISNYNKQLDQKLKAVHLNGEVYQNECHQLVLTETFLLVLNPLRPGNPKTGTLANSVDPNEMPHYAAFHQDLHYLLTQNQSTEKGTHFIFENNSM